MLRLDLSPELESFRKGLRRWLDEHRPPAVLSDASLESFEVHGRAWQRTLSSGGWVGVHWPTVYGGGGLSLVHEAIVQEELVRARSPQLLGLFGLTMVGPVLIAHGTDEQRARFLPRILSGEEVWCQGFSEPGAGSDLAAIRTRGEPVEGQEGEGFLVNGAKVWTSFAHVADWCFVLCRSDPTSTRHHGLSYLLVDMKSRGVSTRPLRQITGDDEFNEVHFENVFVPRSRLVGAEGGGWKIAIATLMHERVVLTFARQLQSEVLLHSLLQRTDLSLASRRRLAAEAATFCALRALSYEHLEGYARGKEPGPEGSLDKLLWTESYQSLVKLALDLEGKGGALAEADSPAVRRYLYSRGRSIAAGTSEIQRSIIAERLLGLPRSQPASRPEAGGQPRTGS